MTIILSNPKKEASEKLAARIEGVLNTLSLAVVRNALEHFDPQKCADLIAQLNPIAVPSIEERNAAALARMRVKQFSRFNLSYTLLNSKVVCQLLGISKQALSQKGSAGKVMAYTYRGRKYYPDFQFLGDKVDPAVGKLIEETGFDPRDSRQINVVLGYLVHAARAVGTDQLFSRYTLIGNEKDRAIMVYDLTRPLEMGQ